MRNFLKEIGYKPYPWGLGRNLGPREGLDSMIFNIAEILESIYTEEGNKQISIIGWSLGGIYGREVAKKSPDLVRQVITLGTPFKGTNNATNVEKLYEFLSKDTEYKNPEIIKKISIPPPVPFTSLYSKTDGVVSWEATIEEERKFVQNIEVVGSSHLGLVHNPISIYIVANRLAQTKDNWTPFKG
jgi:esterase/lipase